MLYMLFLIMTKINQSFGYSSLRRLYNAQRFASTTNDIESQAGFKKISVDDVESLSLSELKVFIKELGGKPRNLRKQELVTECQQIMSIKTPTISPSTSPTTAVSTALVLSTMVEKLPSLTSIEESRSSSSKYTLQNSSLLLSKTNESAKFARSNLTVPTRQLSSVAPRWTRVRNLSPVKDLNENVSEINVESMSITRNEDSISKMSTNPTYRCFSVKQKFPYGPLRNDRLKGTSNSADFELIILGTASCTPNLHRGVSCTAFRSPGQLWLFDCGESTQLQLQKGALKASRISKIFITHNHGDHCFGLGAVLCMLGSAGIHERDNARITGETVEPIEIYGPEGIRNYIRTVTSLTYSRITSPHRIHELKNIPFLHGNFVRHAPTLCQVSTQPSTLYGEVGGGTDIYPDEKGVYHLFEDETFIVKAAPLQHTVPCVGFVVTEKDRPGRLAAEKVEAIVERNKEALSTLYYRSYKKVYSVLKELQPNQCYTFPDGEVISGDDIVEQPKRGRKIVYLGDTCNSSMIAEVASNATVLIHEATNAYDSDAKKKFNSYHRHEYDTISHGHSTPQMAAAFAKKINAKRLILTHFSSRYSGDDSEWSCERMWIIEDMARVSADSFWGENDVIAAWDHMSFFV